MKGYFGRPRPLPIALRMLSKPNNDEPEVHVFGPGYGESVLVHLGGDEWLVIDSCVASGSSEPAALEYLGRIGVPPERVKVIVASHWHDDHIRGLARLVERCREAMFYCSNALTRNEFVVLAQHFEDAFRYGGKVSSGMKELNRVLHVLKARMSNGERPVGYAGQNRSLFYRQSSPYCSVLAVSPSDAEFEGAIAWATSLIAEESASSQTNQPARRAPPPPGPNQTAVAVWAQVGSIELLLGSDLEEQFRGSVPRDDVGWRAVVRSKQQRHGQKAAYFKVPHHGSETGQNDDVWDQLLLPNPLATMSPFQNGRIRLPSRKGIEFLTQRAGDLYITSAASARLRLDRTVEKTIRESTLSFSAVPEMGRVSARYGASGWIVDLSSSAQGLQ